MGVLPQWCNRCHPVADIRGSHETNDGGIHMPEATLHDGSTIEIEVEGDGPPVNGPYAAMLRVTTAPDEMAVEAAAKTDEVAADQQPAIEAGDWSSVQVTMSPDQTRQFVTLYQALQGFDDRAAQAHI